MMLPWHHPNNRAPLRVARDLYFKEFNYDLIFEKTGVPPTVYGIQVRRKWGKVKKRIDDAYLIHLRKELLADKAGNIIKKGAVVIDLYLTRLIARKTEIEGKDAKFASDIMANIHRVKQLEEGKPTDISKVDQMSTEEAKEYLRDLVTEQVKSHDMSMFVDDDVTEAELVKNYTDGNNSGLH